MRCVSGVLIAGENRAFVIFTSVCMRPVWECAQVSRSEPKNQQENDKNRKWKLKLNAIVCFVPLSLYSTGVGSNSSLNAVLNGEAYTVC